MATTYLSRTATSGNNTTGTFSAWIKRGNLSSTQCPIGVAVDGNNFINIQFNSSNQLNLRWYDDGSPDANYNTTAVFRDVSAWYHVVIAFDTTQSTSSDRVKIYVNNTLHSLSGYPPQNNTIMFNTGSATLQVGSSGFANSFFDGIMSHVHWIDGTAYDASAFGQADANGVWTIKTSPSVTYGNNGFFILKDGNSVTDQSGNGNNFTVGGGTLTNTEDCPSNVFATYNPLGNTFPADTFSNGNTTQTTNAANYSYNTSTLGASSGKYYCEIKNSTDNNNTIGIVDRPSTSTTDELTGTTYGWGYYNNGQVYNNGSVAATYSSYTTGDIIGIAMDLDNNKVYFAKNGTWQGSSDPSAGTGGISITDPASNRSGFYFFASGDAATLSAVNQANFGNGYFGTTAVASAGTNASGIGIFEYDVPTGYTALSTKGLNL